MRNTRLARSMAPISSVAASPMRRPHAYITVRHVRWIGLRMQLSRCRTCSSNSASGSRFCRGEAILFSPEQPPHAFKRMAIEETQPVLVDLERAAGCPALAQAEQVAPHLFLAELVRRTPVMRSQLAYRLDVDLLRPEGQPGQRHVLDHPRT